jgi:hypothetical protein
MASASSGLKSRRNARKSEGTSATTKVAARATTQSSTSSATWNTSTLLNRNDIDYIAHATVPRIDTTISTALLLLGNLLSGTRLQLELVLLLHDLGDHIVLRGFLFIDLRVHFGQPLWEFFEEIVYTIACFGADLGVFIALEVAELDDGLVVESAFGLVALVACHCDDYVFFTVFVDLNERWGTSPVQNSVMSRKEDSAVTS